MKKTLLLLLLLSCILLSGCLGMRDDPRAELKLSADVFSVTVDILTELKAQGQLGDDEIKDVGASIHLGERYLRQWQAAVEADEPNAEIVAAFRVLLADLVATKERHQ